MKPSICIRCNIFAFTSALIGIEIGFALVGFVVLLNLKYRTIAQFGKFVFGPWFDVITGLVIISICILLTVLQLLYSIYGIRNKKLGVIVFNCFMRFIQIAVICVIMGLTILNIGAFFSEKCCAQRLLKL